MDFINPKPPSYKGKGKGKAPPPTQGVTGFLAGLWCSLFGGGAAPAYRSKGETNGATAPEASPCWMGLTQTPQYKAPPDPTSDPDPEVPPCAEPMDEECPCDPDVEPEPREIHIYPGA